MINNFKNLIVCWFVLNDRGTSNVVKNGLKTTIYIGYNRL